MDIHTHVRTLYDGAPVYVLAQGTRGFSFASVATDILIEASDLTRYVSRFVLFCNEANTWRLQIRGNNRPNPEAVFNSNTGLLTFGAGQSLTSELNFSPDNKILPVCTLLPGDILEIVRGGAGAMEIRVDWVDLFPLGKGSAR